MDETDRVYRAVGRIDARDRQPMVAGELPGHSGPGMTGPGYSVTVPGSGSGAVESVVLALSRKIACLLLFIHCASVLRFVLRRARRGGLSPLGQPLARPVRTTPVRGRLAVPPALLALLPFAACLASGARTVGAQAVSDIDNEALTLPGGVVRLSAAESDTRYDSRYGSGGLQSLGSYLTLDSLGPSQLPILAPLQSSLRSLTGDPSLGVSLGGTEVTSSVRVSVTPIGLDIGLTRRLTLHAIVPIVRTHNEILFQPNVNGNGNVGLNPALATAAARAVDTSLYGEFAHATASLQSALAACAANPASAPYCASLDAQRTTADQLIAQSSSFAAGLSQVYGGDGRMPFPVVPVGNSPALAAINQRMQAFASRFAHFDSLTGGPQLSSQGPVGAPPLGLGDAQTLLTTDAAGLGYDSLQSVDRVGLGDIEFGATALLLDSFHGNDSARVHPRGFNYRLAVTGLFRLGTGTPIPPNALVGVGTGTGANAVEVHAATDILIGSHFWFSLIARGTQPMADQISARIPLGLGDEFSPLFTQQMVTRTLGRPSISRSTRGIRSRTTSGLSASIATLTTAPISIPAPSPSTQPQPALARLPSTPTSWYGHRDDRAALGARHHLLDCQPRQLDTRRVCHSTSPTSTIKRSSDTPASSAHSRAWATTRSGLGSMSDSWGTGAPSGVKGKRPTAGSGNGNNARCPHADGGVKRRALPRPQGDACVAPTGPDRRQCAGGDASQGRRVRRPYRSGRRQCAGGDAF